MKVKTCIQEHYQARLLFRFEEEIKSLIVESGVKRVYNHKTSFTGKVKGHLRSGKKVTTRNMKITKGKFSSVKEKE